MSDNVVQFPSSGSNSGNTEVNPIELMLLASLAQKVVADVEHILSDHDGNTAEERTTMRRVRDYTMAVTVATLDTFEAVPEKERAYLAYFDFHKSNDDLKGLGSYHPRVAMFNIKEAVDTIRGFVDHSQCQHS